MGIPALVTMAFALINCGADADVPLDSKDPAHCWTALAVALRSIERSGMVG